MPALPTEDRRVARSHPGSVVRFAAPPSPRRAARGSTLSAAATGSSVFGSQRLDALPPSLRDAPDSAWQRFMFWLLAPAPQEVAPPRHRLPQVREDFMLAIADVPGQAAHALRHRIVLAQSLRELWHLRADVFSLVGIEHAQSEAERRLLHLNRHFPVRTARRSQFGSLGGL